MVNEMPSDCVLLAAIHLMRRHPALVNVPDGGPSSLAGIGVTLLTRRRYEKPVVEKVDPCGRKYYPIAGTRVA